MRSKFVRAIGRAVTDAMYVEGAGQESLTRLEREVMRAAITKAVIGVVREEYGNASPTGGKYGEPDQK